MNQQTVSFDTHGWGELNNDIFVGTITVLTENTADETNCTVDGDVITVETVNDQRSLFEAVAVIVQSLGECRAHLAGWPGGQMYAATDTGGISPLPVADHVVDMLRAIHDRVDD